MTRHFMRDTPLYQMEQMMMTPPYFKPRGHSLRRSGFRYQAKDVDCEYCMNYSRRNLCPLDQCICLEERIETGALSLEELLRDCLNSKPKMSLWRRLAQLLYLTMLGLRKGENEYTYAACTKQQAEELICGLREIAPYVVIDCSSYIANDILSAVALMEADSVLRLANCDLKSIGYLSSQLPLLRELHWDEDKQYKAASNIKPLQAADRIGQVLGSVAFKLP